jgi:hypothetical protein
MQVLIHRKKDLLVVPETIQLEQAAVAAELQKPETQTHTAKAEMARLTALPAPR